MSFVELIHQTTRQMPLSVCFGRVPFVHKTAYYNGQGVDIACKANLRRANVEDQPVLQFQRLDVRKQTAETEQ